MNHVFPVPIAIVCMLILLPSATATENPTVDVEISRAEFDSLYLNITITNIDQRDISLTGIEFSVSDPVGASASEKWKIPILLKANKSITHRSKHSIGLGDLMKSFCRRGSENVTVSGSVFVEEGSKSFVVPFHKTTTIFLETDGVNQAVSPIADITFEINRSTDEVGEIKEIITTTNISIYNPNPVAVSMLELDCKAVAMRKKDEKLQGWRSLPGSGIVTNQVIKPMGTYVYSAEKATSNNDIVQYFGTNEPKYIKVKGTAFIVTNEAGWSPAYFDLAFDTMITINGSGISEEVTPITPTPTPVPTSIPDKSVPGFKVVFATTGLLAMAFLSKRRN